VLISRNRTHFNAGPILLVDFGHPGSVGLSSEMQRLIVNRVFALILVLSFSMPQSAPAGIHKQGKVDLSTGYGLDIDNGIPGGFVRCMDCNEAIEPKNFKGSDFWFEGGGKTRYLHPQHGSLFATSNPVAEGPAGCAAATFGKAKLRIDILPIGSRICTKTSEGRFAELRIDGFDQKSKVLSLSYTTWEKETTPSPASPHH
jgi:hypothetical protein